MPNLSWIRDIQGYVEILDENDAAYRRRHTLKFIGVTIDDDGFNTVVTVAPIPVGTGLQGTQGVQGERGEPGEHGQPGFPGVAGAAGERGPVGFSGQDGRDGQDGADGLPGISGSPGSPGVQGFPGADGADGSDGLPGLQGPVGAPGVDGVMGAIGFPGQDGVDGQDGLPGQQGVAGATGSPGAAGERGPVGFPGYDGQDGQDGLPGQQGANGADGVAGTPGAAGVPGPIGFSGADGADGADGLPGFPGTAGAAGSPGIAGIAGPIGFPGQDGQDAEATFFIGPAGPPGADGSGGGGGTTLMALTVVEVNLGSIPTLSGTFQITGLSGLTPGTNVLITQINGPYTGKGTLADEAEDQVSVSAQVTSSTTITAYWNAVESPIIGNIKFGYAVGSSITLTNLGTAPPYTVLGNPTSATAVRQDIAAGSPGMTLVRDASTIGLVWKFIGDGLALRSNSDGTISLDLRPDSDMDQDTSGLTFRKQQRRMIFWEDFDHVRDESWATAGTELHLGQTHWTGMTIGGGADLGTATVPPGEDNHPGILRMTTDNVVGDAVIMFKGRSRSDEWILGQDVYSFEAIVRAPSVTGVFIQIGFENNVFAATTDSILFYLDSASDSSFHTFTREAGVNTDIDTGIAMVLNTWYRLRILQDTLGTIEFYINDVLAATHSTNVPDTEGLNIGLAIQSTGGANRSLDVDYVAFESKDLGNRF